MSKTEIASVSGLRSPVRAGIIGATGYAGGELARLLLGHPLVKVEALTSQSHAGQAYGDVFENFRHTDLICETENPEELAERCDVLFLALPHGLASQKVTAELLSKVKVIDFGADFRLADAAVYEQWYKTAHHGREVLREAVYGLCELYRERIKSARLAANPGCYTTCAILCLYPLVAEGVVDPDSLIVDAMSGVSGAGRGLDLGTHFDEADGNVKAYKVGTHRHTPEIEQALSQAAGKPVTISFTPHMVPMNRGILATCYGSLTASFSEDGLRDIYRQYYGNEFFIRLTKPGVLPETKWVKGSNFCDIGLAVDSRTGRVIVVGALDNLVKGAAGQAVQNMNLMFGLDEKMGLEGCPVFPG